MTGFPDFIDSRYYTVEEYFAIEEKSETKHDYFDGRILDMAGGTTNHNSITSNLIRECGQALKGSPCRVFGSDQRLQDRRSTLYTYPDVQIVCGPLEYGDRGPHRMTLTNPKVIVEVLSPSTQLYDRTDKFQRYVAVESLTDFVLVSQDRPRVETYHRREDGTWLFSWVEGLDATLHVQSVDVRVPLAEIYRDVTFESAAAAPTDPSGTPPVE